MTQEIFSLEQIANEVAIHSNEAGADIQRYIILPALLDVIGSVKGKDVLELYCGAGYLSRRLAAMGANVTAVDTSRRLIEIAGEINTRENDEIRYAVADSSDMSVVEDSTFDTIVCNMGLMMTRDLGGTIAELARLVKLGGRFVFAVLHPCFCNLDSCWAGDENGRMSYKTIGNYFSEGWWTSELISGARDGKNKVKHRTLSRYVNALGARGFTVRRIIEPKPSPETIAYKPQLAVYERLPVVMIFEAIFPYL